MRKNYSLFFLFVAAAVVLGSENTISSLKARYSQIRSVHFIAVGEMRIRDGNKAVSGDVGLEFWASGEKYRVKSHASPALGLADDVEVAYDQAAYQVFDPSASVLHVSRHEITPAPISIPNPLFLPLEFLGNHVSRLAELSNRDAWSQSERMSPGGHIEHKDHAYDVRFSTFAKTMVPTSITRTENGVKTLEIEASRFVTPASEVGPLPTSLKINAYAQDGATRIMEAVLNVETLEINQEVPDSVFKIEVGGVKKVWDIDSKTFVKHPDSKMLNRRFDPTTKE